MTEGGSGGNGEIVTVVLDYRPHHNKRSAEVRGARMGPDDRGYRIVSVSGPRRDS